MTKSEALLQAIDAVDTAMTALYFVSRYQRTEQKMGASIQALQAVQADLIRIYIAVEKPALDG